MLLATTRPLHAAREQAQLLAISSRYNEAVMAFLFLSSVMTGLFVKGWLGKLVVFPLAFSCWETVSTIRHRPGAGFAGHLGAFSGMLILSVLISGTVGVVTETVKSRFLGEPSTGRWSAQEEAAIQHFRRALNLAQEVTRLVNERVRREGYVIRLGPSALAECRDLLSQALDEARAIDNATLAKIHPELPNAFRTYFQRSVELSLAQYANALSQGTVDTDVQLESQRLDDVWADWYSEHLREVSARLK